MKKIIILSTFALLAAMTVQAQYPVKIHSHNDYTRTVPFYQAYAQKVASIECDMHFVNGQHLVGHDAEDLVPEMTFEKLYYEPVVNLFRINGGHAWADDPNRILQLMLEIKTNNTAEYLKALVEKLERHPDVFNPSVNPKACRIVITGNIPDPQDFDKYPDYIKFDGDYGKEYTTEQLAHIGMISTCFDNYADWNGKGTLVREQEEKVRKVIADVHALGKPVRFWGAPDGVTAWYTFLNLGADYINTDRPEACCEFLGNWNSKNYGIKGTPETTIGGVTKTDRLDKITKDFTGFQNDKLQLRETIETYTPTYLNDGANKPIKNVILLIGDGMGLQQMIAADRVNFGLSMMNMRYMGMVNNSSEDAFTTDSPASGSAISTGEKHLNRHVAVTADGTPRPSLTDFFYDKGKACGVVTLGDVEDATPAAFYAHCVERDSSDDITRCLLDNKLTLLAGSGIKGFERRNDGVDLIGGLRKLNYDFVRSIDKIDASAKKTICIDEEMDKAADVDNINLLAQTTERAINKLSAASKKGFFLMVEGAKIDYAGHSRFLPGSIMETLSFDLAVKEALKFADKNGETLVIVTADHECGALILVDGDNTTGHVTGYYLSNDHTPIYPIVLSYGPGAQNFIGRYYQYELGRKIKALF